MPPNTLRDLQESRGKNVAEMNAICGNVAGDSRDLSGEKCMSFYLLDTEVRSLNNRLADAQKLTDFERPVACDETVTGNAIARLSLEVYSIRKALGESHSEHLTRLETGWHREQARDRGEVRRVLIPTKTILGGVIRALTTAGTSGKLVATNLTAVTDRRPAALKVETMGTNILRSLSSNMELPRRPFATQYDRSGPAGGQ